MTAKTEHAEQRRDPRVAAADQAFVRDAHSGEVIGELVNVSAGGLMLSGTVRIECNSIIQMRIPLPTAEGPVEIRVGAESLWCEDANASGIHWTGFQIIDISPEDQSILTRIVEA